MQVNRRILFLALIPLFAIGALAAGLGPLPWDLFDRSPTGSPYNDKDRTRQATRANQPAPAADNSASTTKQPAPAATKSTPATKQTTANNPKSNQTTEASVKPKASIDVARINPSGTSVIAGQAKPSSRVTIMADDQPVGTVTTDASGDFVLVTPHKFANPEAKLSIKHGDHMPRAVAAARPANPTKPLAVASRRNSTPQRTAAEVTRQMMRRLENLTREAEANPKAQPRLRRSEEQLDRSRPQARREQVAGSGSRVEPELRTAKHQPAGNRAPGPVAHKSNEQTAEDKPSPPVAAALRTTRSQNVERKKVIGHRTDLPRERVAAAPTMPTRVLNAPRNQRSVVAVAPKQPLSVTTNRTRVAAVAQPTVSPAQISDARPVQNIAVSKPLPVPVQFVYLKDVFTEQGREAAALLLKYFKVKRFTTVTLSGHADERGTDALNMRLSRERLQRLEKFLRAGGFKGKLNLIPKGATQEFKGVDRSQFALEELYQLDRRVEVVNAR